MATLNSEEEDKNESLKFLERDFNQAYLQMRHYDAQIFEICKFGFLGYSTVIGIGLSIYQFAKKELVDLSLAAIGVLSLGLIYGLFVLALTVRNRVYFVVLARYVNEHRKFFFSLTKLFPNRTRIYCDPALPYFFDWRSTQLIYSYLISVSNAMLAGALYFVTVGANAGLAYLILGMIVIQLAFIAGYLRSRESKSTNEAVFGTNGD